MIKEQIKEPGAAEIMTKEHRRREAGIKETVRDMPGQVMGNAGRSGRRDAADG